MCTIYRNDYTQVPDSQHLNSGFHESGTGADEPDTAAKYSNGR